MFVGYAAEGKMEGRPRPALPMNRYLEAFQGFNLAALLRGLKEGPRTLGRASCAAYWAARSAANRHQAVIRRQLNQIPVVHLTHSSNSLGRPKMPDQAAGDEI